MPQFTRSQNVTESAPSIKGSVVYPGSCSALRYSFLYSVLIFSGIVSILAIPFVLYSSVACTKQDPFPRAGLCCPVPSIGNMNPSDSLCSPPEFRFLICKGCCSSSHTAQGLQHWTVYPPIHAASDTPGKASGCFRYLLPESSGLPRLVTSIHRGFSILMFRGYF